MLIPDVFNVGVVTVTGIVDVITGFTGVLVEDNGNDEIGFGLFRDKYGTGESGGLCSLSDRSLSFSIEQKKNH